MNGACQWTLTQFTVLNETLRNNTHYDYLVSCTKKLLLFGAKFLMNV